MGNSHLNEEVLLRPWFYMQSQPTTNRFPLSEFARVRPVARMNGSCSKQQQQPNERRGRNCRSSWKHGASQTFERTKMTNQGKSDGLFAD